MVGRVKPGLTLLVLLILGSMTIGTRVGPVHGSETVFSSAINLSNDLAFAFPSLAVGGTNVYVTWENGTFGGNTDVLFTASNDSGTTFGPVIDLSKSLPAGNNVNQQVAVSGSYVYVVWQESTAGNDEVWLATSSNNGQSFGGPVNLSNDPQFSGLPQVSVSGTFVYVAWVNQTEAGSSPDILFSASANNGQTFSVSKLNLSNDRAATAPVMAASANNVYVAWQDNSTGAHDMFLKTSTNNGSGFGPAQNLSKNTVSSGARSFGEQIVVAGSNVYAVWTKDTPTATPDSTTFAASTNSGASFGVATQLTISGKTLHPQVAATGSNVYVLWEDDSTPGTAVATLAASYNNGANFNTPIVLSSITGFAQLPQLAISGTNVYVTWYDTSSTTNTVFFRSSADNAATFGSNQNLSTNSGLLTGAVIAASGSKVYVAWQDDPPSGINRVLFRANVGKINYVLNALQSGWNSTFPPGTSSPCTNQGCNPALIRFKGKSFTVEIIWKDLAQQNIAIYSNGTSPSSVSPTDTCSLTNGVGCLAKSQPVNSTSPVGVLTFTPTMPGRNYTGIGKYEYYSQYSPTTVHGQILVYKSPDMAPPPNGDGVVNILDMATVGLAFGSTPGSAHWNPTADLDNNGKVDILDVAFAAIYFGKSV